MCDRFKSLYKIIAGLAIICVTQGYVYSQEHEKNTRLLPKLLKKEQIFDSILNNPDVYEVQIIYTQIERRKNKITFIDNYYNVDKRRYFYPSGTVFLPIAALTLEKINRLSKEHDIHKYRYVRIDNALTQEILIYRDPSSETHHASFAHFIKQMFVSGNKQACNFCYDFLDQRYLNERMHELGYPDSWLLHKLNSEAPEMSRQSNTVTFFRTDVKGFYVDIIYLKRHPTTIPFFSTYVKNGEYNPIDYYSNRPKTLLGKGYVKNGNVVDSAADFTNRNKFTVENMHAFLKSIVFPDVHKNKPELSDDDYAFLYKQMLENNADFNYIMNDRLNDSSIKIFNNSGKDAGFMVDNAYIIDTKNGTDFFLTIAVKCNKSDIFGEEYYEYEKTGLSLMKNISNCIHRYEINRKRQNVNFDEFLSKINNVGNEPKTQ
jgi:hypothetical protein